MQKVLILFLFFSVPYFSFAQFGAYNESTIRIAPAVSYQGQFFGELNIMYAEGEGTYGPCGDPLIGARIGVEANFDKDHFIYAPKIGYEIIACPILFRLNIIDYVDNSNMDLRILPEIGLAYLDIVTLAVGYNAPILKFKTDITKFCITLTFEINTCIPKDHVDY
jgi:hypothetical protein